VGIDLKEIATLGEERPALRIQSKKNQAVDGHCAEFEFELFWDCDKL